MRILSRLVSSVVAITVLPLPAIAGDPAVRPPVITADSVMPEDSSSGWYLRGDIGVARNTAPKLTSDGVTETNRTAAASAAGDFGFGYRFNDNLRSDLTFEFLTSHKVTGQPNAFAKDSLNQDSFAVMANGYYDIIRYAGLTPYIGAGIGIARTNSDAGLRNLGGVSTFSYGKSATYGLAAAAMAGIAIDIGHGMQADLGYRFAWVNRARTGQPNCACGPINVSNMQSHQFRIGLRYLIN